MFKRLKETILEIIQQADLILLGLCCAASVFGIAMIYSATRYNNDNRKIIVQTAALLIGIVVYFGISMIDLEMLIKRWKWIAAFDVLFILLLKTPFGVSDNTGNTAWLKFPFLPVSIGPAEVVKITFTLLLAKQLEWLGGGKTGSEILFRRLLCGRSYVGDSGTVLCYFRRYGKCADVPADLRGDVLRGGLCPAVVRTAFRRVGGRHRRHHSL